jgi:chromodomain-helicase-DNA-binding protein 7
MFERASRKLGMEQALFQKGAFGDKDNNEVSKDMKIDPKEIEYLLKYGAYAFLEEGSGDNLNNTHIDDILAKNSKDQKEYKMTKGLYTLQKSKFDVNEGRSSTHKSGSASKSGGVPNVNDPNFWEKVLPFEGFNPK